MLRIVYMSLVVILVVGLVACTGPTADVPGGAVDAPDESGQEAEQGADEPSTSGEEIVLGVIAPLTGSKAEQGQQFKEGAEVAVADLNAAGGILGRQVRLEIVDDQGEPNQAAAAAQKLASNSDVVAVIGPSSTASSSAAIPILESAGLPAISPSASTPTLVTENECFFLMSLPLTSYGPLVPEVAVEQFGAQDLAIIHVKDDWGEGVTAVSEEWSQQHNISVVATASYTQGARDFKSQLTTLFAEEPDALVLNTHYTEGALIAKQARDLGYEGPIVGQGTIVYPQFLELGGEGAEGVVSWVDFLASLPSEKVQQAVSRFEDAIGKEPLQYHVSTYDAVHILAAAIEKVGGTDDDDALCKAIGETKDFPGLVVNFSYNEERLPEKDVFLVVVENGEWVTFEGE